MFQDIVDDEKVKHVFNEFIHDSIQIDQGDIKWNPKKIITQTMKNIWDKECHTGKEMGEKYILNHDSEKIREKINDLIKYLNHSKDIKINKTFFHTLNKSVFDFYKLKNHVKKELNELRNKGSAPIHEEYQLLWDEMKSLLKNYVEELSHHKVFSYRGLYRLFKEKWDSEIIKKKKIILLNQLNHVLKQVTQSSAGNSFLPEIYYYLSERYYHFLMDEFQDTNYLQWQNLKLFIEEALSKGGSLFVVGDKKQSIYRWRGGAPQVFDEMENNYKTIQHYFATPDVNYRSGEYIVHFVNSIFNYENIKRWLEQNGYEPGTFFQRYHFSLQTFPEEKKNTGYVFIEKIEEVENKETLIQIVKEKFLERIEQLLQSYEYRDIAVLVRTNDEVTEVVQWLLEKQINVQATSTINIKYQPLILELMNLLQFLSRPIDNFSFINFITGEIFNQRIKGDKGKIWDWIHQTVLEKQVEFLYQQFQKDYTEIWRDYFEEFFKTIGYLPLYELVVSLLKKWNIMQNFKESISYFIQLLELIKIRENTPENNINYFLEYFFEAEEEDENFLLKIPESLEAIKIMTTHRAKGLQFPVVLMPLAHIIQKRNNLFFDERGEQLQINYITQEDTFFSSELKQIYETEKMEILMDELNNFYVACTRAEKELYLYISDTYENKKNNLVDLLSLSEKNYTLGKPVTAPKISSPVRMLSELDFDDFEGAINWFHLLKTKIKIPMDISKKRIEAAQKGMAIHYILSFIKEIPDPMIDERIKNGAKRFNIPLEQIKPVIDKVIHRFGNFFNIREGEKVYTEKPIINTFGEMRVLDRFVERNDVIELVDYKTGEMYKEEHESQLKQYIELLQSFYPQKKIKGYLLYIDEDRLKEV